MAGKLSHRLLAVVLVISSLSVSIASGAVSTPTFSPAGGIYNSEPNVVVTCATAGATIHYTSGVDANTTLFRLKAIPL